MFHHITLKTAFLWVFEVFRNQEPSINPKAIGNLRDHILYLIPLTLYFYVNVLKEISRKQDAGSCWWAEYNERGSNPGNGRRDWWKKEGKVQTNFYPLQNLHKIKSGVKRCDIREKSNKFWIKYNIVLSCSVVSNSLWPHGL